MLIYFIAPRARKFAQFTIPDLLEARYNQTARVLGVIAVLFAYTAITSYQFIGGGDILHLIFPEVQHEAGTSSFIAKPGADAALHHRRRKQTDEQECHQNETKRKQWFLA